ncbi:FAD-dependent oxidoreductase [Geotalea sp. SG265]|uniref:FAD-dependent oxidoreductase n=1 Tax=Geotalea sp. SG265 TaxID=2922867 RepID=UPI001FAED82C|nr:FAD-dependent oxidoreductase [Geotalea sp. SG265]
MNPSASWDKTFDVVVIGYGGAGAAAAIAAHDAGAEVLILESTSRGGGNTLVSFGGFASPGETDKAVSYISALYEYSHSEKDDGLIRAFVEESSKTIAWLKNLQEGVEVLTYGGASYPDIPGAEAIKRYVIKGPHKGATAFAQNLWLLLSGAVEARGIPVLTQAPAERLLTGPDGAVTGIMASIRDKKLLIRARDGVVLTTGGYGSDAEMLRNHAKGSPLYTLGHQGNRGDGVRLAQKVGAGLWHMNGVSCAFGIKVPQFESALLIAIGAAGQILVDRSGKRFVNEGAIERHAGLLSVDFFDSQSLTYPRIPSYLLFDEATRKRGPVSRTAGLGYAGVQHTWSKDNSVEIMNGWIIRDETLSGLAGKIGVDAKTLQHTVELWNRSVRAGRDSLYDRELPHAPLTALIETGPFHALEIYPCLLNTQGGPKRNEKAEVTDPFGEPIPGLYSAGELGSMWGLIYQGGGNIAEALAFGRIAGAGAALRHATGGFRRSFR